jgi:hypothetical protein
MALRDVLLSIAQTPHRLRRRALVTWTPTQELNEVRDRSGVRMKRRLEWYDLVGLGVGDMLGAGVFVTTGRVARDTAGPAVFASYVVAGVSALLRKTTVTQRTKQRRRRRRQRQRDGAQVRNGARAKQECDMS